MGGRRSGNGLEVQAGVGRAWEGRQGWGRPGRVGRGGDDLVQKLHGQETRG